MQPRERASKITCIHVFEVPTCSMIAVSNIAWKAEIWSGAGTERARRAAARAKSLLSPAFSTGDALFHHNFNCCSAMNKVFEYPSKRPSWKNAMHRLIQVLLFLKKRYIGTWTPKYTCRRWNLRPHCERAPNFTPILSSRSTMLVAKSINWSLFERAKETARPAISLLIF